MSLIFMKSEKSKTFDCNRPLLNILEKINLKKSDQYAVLSNLSLYYTWKNIKKNNTKLTNLKYQPQGGTINLNYLLDLNLYQIFVINSSI